MRLLGQNFPLLMGLQVHHQEDGFLAAAVAVGDRAETNQVSEIQLEAVGLRLVLEEPVLLDYL